MSWVTAGPGVTVTVEPGKISEVAMPLQESSPSPGWVHLEVGARTRATPGCTIEPRDVAGLAVYLLSAAAAMMTGALIDFDQNVMGAYG